jgi:soluble lytic murein transglycosylase-like protein
MLLVRTLFLSILAALAVFYAPVAYADFYTYEDGEGVVHLTNVPTENNVKYRLILKEKRVLFDRRIFVDMTKYDSLISHAAQKYKMDKALIKAVIKAESNFNHQAVSPKGARGLMQLMPSTAAQLQVEDSFHPEKNIEGGVRYLRYLLHRFNGNLALALAAYNAGEKAVTRHGGIPPYRETQNYVQRVQSYINMFR